MKSISERSPLITGAVGIILISGFTLAALQYQNLPFVTQRTTYSAYFADAAGLRTNAFVEVSGHQVGKVTGIELDGPGVLVTFKVDSDVGLGTDTTAAIKTRGLLGTKTLDLIPRGDGQLEETIAMDRTTTPYQLPDTLGELASTISGLNTNQLSDSLAALAQTFANTPPHLRDAVQGLGRVAETLNARDAQLRTLLENAAKATDVLGKRTDQVVSLVKDSNALLAQLRTQSAALEQIWGNIAEVSRQLKALIAENRDQLRPALDKLNEVLAVVDERKDRLKEAIPLLNRYVMQLNETVSGGPFFKVYVSNLLPGEFVQPFIDAAFSDLGVDPATLLPSQLSDPQVGQPGTPALPVPYPRTGQGGEPRLNLPDAITGNLDPNAPAQFPGRYPYSPEPPAPPPGGPPPGPPAPAPASMPSTPEPTPPLEHGPAPGEASSPNDAPGEQQ